MNIIPNLFVIGAPKAGTSAFVEALRNHPDIFVPEKKEPRYFDAHVFYDYEEDYPIKNLEDYLKLYSDQKSKIAKFRVDGSTFSMYSMKAIEGILNLCPSAYFVIIIRDPVSASKSMHAQRLKYIDKKMREVSENFCHCWRLLEHRKNGKGYPKNCRNKFLFRYDLLYSYELYISNILNRISNDKICFISYEEYKKNPEKIYRAFCKFIGIGYDPIMNPGIVNKSYKLNKTIFTSSFFSFLKVTYPFRKIIGLSGDKYRWVKERVYKKSIIATSVTVECENDVRKFFSNTYDYLEKNKNKLNFL